MTRKPAPEPKAADFDPCTPIPQKEPRGAHSRRQVMAERDAKRIKRYDADQRDAEAFARQFVGGTHQ